MRNQDHLIGTSWIIVRVGVVVNRLFLLAVGLGLLMSWLLATKLTEFLALSGPAVDAASELVGLRLEMLIGIVMATATDRLLTALGQMIDSARAGDPFVAVNARRLQAIGWSLLVLQLLDILGLLLCKLFPSLGSAAPNVDFSPGGWVAVLMVFVLSRVFAAGAAMRDELEGTV
jgi:hypothetical protein